MTTKAKALLIDITRCIGCRSCELACKQAHRLPEATEPELSSTALTVVEEHQGRFVRRLCMHCQDPACVSVCPVGALQKTSRGPVVYAADRCIGCRYCMLACPFGVPRYEWDRVAPYVKKCDMCAERFERGEVPACVEACPVGATEFGDRDEILAEARRRLGENATYIPHIYGTEEVGGTSVFFLSDVPFEKLGFAIPPMNQPLPTLTAPALSEVPTVLLLGSSLLYALYWITERRQEVALAEAEEQSRSEPSAQLVPAWRGKGGQS
jgi:formate dehydrogenase iron-sulfur subunit